MAKLSGAFSLERVGDVVNQPLEIGEEEEVSIVTLHFEGTLQQEH